MVKEKQKTYVINAKVLVKNLKQFYYRKNHTIFESILHKKDYFHRKIKQFNSLKKEVEYDVKTL